MVKEDLMWKRYKYMILSFIFVVGIFVVGVKLPDFVSATGADKTNLIYDKEMRFAQASSPISDPGRHEVSMKNIIETKIDFKIPFKKVAPATPVDGIEAGDYVEFEIGDKMRFVGSDKTANQITREVFDKDTGKKLCDVTYTKESSTGVIKAKFDFTSLDPSLAANEGATIHSELTTEVNPDLIDYANYQNEKIRLDQDLYKIKDIEINLEAAGVGVLDRKEGVINWTYTVTGSSINTNTPISIAGFVTYFDLGNPLQNGDIYVPGSFSINNISVSDTELTVDHSPRGKYSYVIKASELGTNKGSAVIRYQSRISYDKIVPGDSRSYGSGIGIKTRDNAYYVSKDIIPLDIWAFGDKDAEFINIGSKKGIRWVIRLNLRPTNIGDVVVEEFFKNDTMGGVSQTFKQARYKTNESTSWDNATVLTPDINAGGHVQVTIPGVSTTVWVAFDVELDPFSDDDYAVFENEATIKWGSSLQNIVHVSKETSSGTVGLEKTVLSTVRTNHPKAGTIFYGDYEAEWNLSVTGGVIKGNDYYLYDTFIFDTSVQADRSNIKTANGFTVREYGTHTVSPTLTGGINFEKVMPINEENRHQRLVDPANPLTSATAGMTSKVYEILKGTKVVGHLLEINLKPGVDNKAVVKSRITDIDTVFDENNAYGYNYMVLTRGTNLVQEQKTWYKFKPRLIRKQTLSRDVAQNFLEDFNLQPVKTDARNNSGGQGDDTDKVGYDIKTKSIVYMICVNASGINDEYGDLGKFIVEDELDSKFKFVPMIKGANPADDKYFLVYRGNPIAGRGSDTPNATVIPDGNPLSQAELTTNKIQAFPVDTGDKRTGYKFTFDKIKGPYVIFLKAEMVDKTKGNEFYNELKYIVNKATISLEGTSKEFKSTLTTLVNDTFLTKSSLKTLQVNNDPPYTTKDYNFGINEHVTWEVGYIPFKKFDANDNTQVTIVDTLDDKSSIRRVKGSNKLLFEKGNYRIFKAKSYINVNKVDYIEGEEITTGLDKIFVYDTNTGKLKINIPDKNQTYLIKYITDFTARAIPYESSKNIAELYYGTENYTDINPRKRDVNIGPASSAIAYGSVFDNKYRRLYIRKTNAGGNILPGAKFNLKKVAEGTVPVTYNQTQITDTNGLAKFEGLTNGEYILTEVTPPSGYADDELTCKIKVEELEVGFKASLVGDYGDQVKLVDNDLTVINYPASFETINILKTDINGNKLSGAKFRLKKTVAGSTDGVDKGLVTTDGNGEAKFENLKVGYYTLTEETAPAGFTADEEAYKIKIVRDGANLKMTLDGDYGDRAKFENNKLKVINYRNPSIALKITKTNAKGDKLKDAKFKLVKDAVGTIPEEEKGTETTDVNGKASFESLKEGDYTLTEEAAPEGYKLSDTAFKIKITRQGEDLNMALIGVYEGKAKLEANKLTVINLPAEKPVPPGGGGGENPNPAPPQTPNTEEPKPTPKGDGEPKKPDKPENPKKDKPSDKGGKDKPSDPDEPGPNKDKPSVPTYPLDNTPDPNLPNSPKEIDVIYRDGNPIGRFIKRDREDGKKEYVLKRDGTPLTRFKKINKAELPKTGGVDNIYYYLFGAGFALVSGMISGIMARRRYTVRKRNSTK